MELLVIVAALLIISSLYSSVGHGGASGYIAVLTLVGYSPVFIRQDSLILNLLVSAIAFIQFYRAGFFSWEMFLPLIVGSIPAAWLGGGIQLDMHWYKFILGLLLLFPAILFLVDMKKEEVANKKMPFILSLTIGIVLGFISGLTGIGGGVFLSPILVMGRWAGQKTTASISAPFIFVNSAAGLCGAWGDNRVWDTNVLWFAMACVLGAFVGATFGAGKFDARVLKKILAFVLLIAAAKLLLT